MLSLLERQTDRQKGRSKIPAELDLWAGHVISGREELPLGLGALTLLLCGSSLYIYRTSKYIYISPSPYIYIGRGRNRDRERQTDGQIETDRKRL